MLKTYKYRLFPTKKQQTVLNKTLKECCWLYNYFLEQRKTLWEKKKKSMSYYTQAVSLVKLKKKRKTLTEVHSQVLQNVAMRIDLAFKAFFRRVKAKEKPGYPRFKGKGWYDSITYPQEGFKLIDNKLKLSKIGFVKIKLHRPVKGVIKTCTIKRQSNKWHICFTVECKPKLSRKNKRAVGIDVGIENFATLSNSERIENPHFFKTDQKALTKAQRKLSKQKKKTLERYKARKVVGRIHERISNRRNNFCHQITRKLINRFSIICIEDLSINKMKESNFRNINRSIGDAAWGQFARYLTYKAENAGKILMKVNPAYTSQTCSKCGYRKAKKLFERIHVCCSCGFKISRDHNASLNILALGLQSVGSTRRSS